MTPACGGSSAITWDEARLYEDYTGVEAIGIDETSRKGHRYITVVADLVERKRNLRGPGQGLDHDQTVRAGFSWTTTAIPTGCVWLPAT